MKLFRTGLVGLLAATSVIFVPMASADPDAVASAKADLDRIQEESSALDAKLIETISRAEESEGKLETIKQDLSTQESKVAQLGTNLGDLAMMQLNSGGGLGGSVDITGQLLSSGDDSTFLSGLGTIQNETDRSVADLQSLQVEQARLDSLRDQQSAITESLKADRASQEKLAADYDAKEAEAQKVYDRLSAEEQERLKELERKRQEEAAAREAQEAQQSSASPSPTSSPSSQSSNKAADGDKSEMSDSPSTGGGSGRASQAVNYALGQVGKGYVMGTAGPSTFDCSGLMYAAYKQVGISLPRTSQTQYSAGSSVSKGDLQPGDLVFYYSGITHVGMYIGNGKIVHAANPRSGVVTADVNSMPYMGARRVG